MTLSRFVLIELERARHRDIIAMLKRAKLPAHYPPSEVTRIKAEVAEELKYRESMLRMLTHA